jgi:hypothetical protein
VICAFLFRDVTNDISGFQNRMGLFFFILALFGFSCLTSLGVFAGERILFMRERCAEPLYAGALLSPAQSERLLLALYLLHR